MLFVTDERPEGGLGDDAQTVEQCQRRPGQQQIVRSQPRILRVSRQSICENMVVCRQQSSTVLCSVCRLKLEEKSSLLTSLTARYGPARVRK